MGGLRRAAAFSTSGPGVLGSCISGAFGVQAGRRRLSSKPGCPGEGSSQVPGVGGAAGPSSDPTFAFHVVVHLKLHLAGPEEVALGTAEVAAVTAAESVLGTLDAEGGEGKGGALGSQGKGAGEK